MPRPSTPRIDGALVSGYFDRRGRVWEEPIDRNVWSLLERFGDAEIAALVLPRHLVIEHADVPSFTSSKGALADAVRDVGSRRVRPHSRRCPAFPRPSLVAGDGDRPVAAISTKALGEFAKRLGFTLTTRRQPARSPTAGSDSIRPRATPGRCSTWSGYVQALVRGGRARSRSGVSLHRPARIDRH